MLRRGTQLGALALVVGLTVPATGSALALYDSFAKLELTIEEVPETLRIIADDPVADTLEDAIGNAIANADAQGAIGGNGGFSLTLEAAADGSADVPPYGSALSGGFGDGSVLLVNEGDETLEVLLALSWELEVSVEADDPGGSELALALADVAFDILDDAGGFFCAEQGGDLTCPALYADTDLDGAEFGDELSGATQYTALIGPGSSADVLLLVQAVGGALSGDVPIPAAPTALLLAGSLGVMSGFRRRRKTA